MESEITGSDLKKYTLFFIITFMRDHFSLSKNLRKEMEIKKDFFIRVNKVY